MTHAEKDKTKAWRKNDSVRNLGDVINFGAMKLSRRRRFEFSSSSLNDVVDNGRGTRLEQIVFFYTSIHMFSKDAIIWNNDEKKREFPCRYVLSLTKNRFASSFFFSSSLPTFFYNEHRTSLIIGKSRLSSRQIKFSFSIFNLR